MLLGYIYPIVLSLKEYLPSSEKENVIPKGKLTGSGSMESLVISTGLILDMEIKESQKPTSLQNWGAGEAVPVLLIYTSYYH